MARVWSAVDAPEAKNMLFMARDSVVASSSPPQSGASCCVMDTMPSRDVGIPSMPEDSLLMAASASEAPYPRFCITFGKLAIVSTRETAASMDEEMATVTFESAFAARFPRATPLTIFPNDDFTQLPNELPNEFPALVPEERPTLLLALVRAFAKSLVDGMTVT